MIFRGEIGSSDWCFGKGKQCYLTGNDAIAKNIETRLKTVYSEWFADQTAGVPWFTILGQKNTGIVLVTLRTAILQSYGVIRITDLSYQVDSARAITVTYSVDTIFSQNLAGQVAI